MPQQGFKEVNRIFWVLSCATEMSSQDTRICGVGLRSGSVPTRGRSHGAELAKRPEEEVKKMVRDHEFECVNALALCLSNHHMRQQVQATSSKRVDRQSQALHAHEWPQLLADEEGDDGLGAQPGKVSHPALEEALGAIGLEDVCGGLCLGKGEEKGWRSGRERGEEGSEEGCGRRSGRERGEEGSEEGCGRRSGRERGEEGTSNQHSLIALEKGARVLHPWTHFLHP